MAEPVTARTRLRLAPRALSLDRPIARLLLAWLTSVTLAYLLRNGLALPPPGKALAAMLAESVVYLVYFVALVSFAPVRAWLRAIPSPHRTVLAVFFFLIATGQLTLLNRDTFPFPGWTMYGRKEAPAMLEYYRYHGIDRNGRKLEVDPAKLFTFVNVAEIASRVKGFGRTASSPTDDPAREAARAKVRDWLLAIGTAYNLEHPDAPLRSLEFIRYNWEFRRVPASEVPPESVVGIELPEAGAR